jgi:hypothetical protein
LPKNVLLNVQNNVRTRLRKIYSICDFLDNDEELVRKLSLYGKEILENCVNKLKEALNDPFLDELSAWQRREIEEMLEKRLQRAKELLTQKPIKLSVYAGSECYEDEELPILVEVENPNAVKAHVSISVEGGFQPIGELPSSLDLEPLARESIQFSAKPLGTGVRKLVVKAYDGGRQSRELSVDVKPFKVELEASVEPPAEVTEGEEILMKVRMRNKGSVPLTISMRNPFAGEEVKEVELEPGSSEHVEFKGMLSAGEKTIRIPPLEYRDPRGQTHKVMLEELKVSVKPRVVPSEKPEERFEKPVEQPMAKEEKKEAVIDLEEAISTAAKHAIVAIIGGLIGSRFPERKEYPKPVYVEDLPYETREDVTVILEDPAAVFEEDRGDYILIRRAKPAEVRHLSTPEAARRLSGGFKLAIDALMNSWKPDPEASLSRKEKNVSSEYIEKLAKKERERGRPVTAEELERRLPENFYVEYTFHKGTFRKTILKVYAGACSRLEELYVRDRDAKPLSIKEALETLGLEHVGGEYQTVFILASPTGWESSSIELVKNLSGNVLYMLVDLKSGEAYYNEKEVVVSELANALKYSREFLSYDEKVVHLDKLLLEGKITEEHYKNELEKIFTEVFRKVTLNQRSSEQQATPA